jgi:hypothetical protein
MGWVTDVPVMDRLTAGPERTELEEAWWELYQAQEDTLSALEDVSDALKKAGWPTEGAEAVQNRLNDASVRVDSALTMNGYSV